ncbi:MAG: NUDIX domain-containing protein [Saprospiraceae bacterium]|nr:NUDIX domain-containing protein [Saprospiraceae bacterium]
MAEPAIILKSRLILYHFGQILLLKQTKPNGGNFTLVGGTIEGHEFARESLVREALEEAAIKIRESDLELVHVLHKRSRFEHRVVFYFITNKWDGNIKALETHKFKAAKWFPIDKLPKNLTGTVQHVLEEYKKGNLYSEYFKK